MVEEHFASLGARRVRYLEAGDGWPLVLLHAFPMTADLWRAQLEHAPEGWRFIAPDVTVRPGAESIEQMAADVLQLADQIEIERAVIGGMSMGGYVTLAAYRLAPERFSGMVLANTRATADTPEVRQGRDRLIALARDGGASAIAADMLPKLVGATSMRERPEVLDRVRAIAASNSGETLAGALAAIKARPDASDILERISCATLVIAADEDVITPPAEVERMQQCIPRSRLVVLHKAGHLSNLDAPDDFSRALTDFLTSRM